MVDFPREYRAKAMEELKAIATVEKDYLTPEQWKPVAYAAEAPSLAFSYTPASFANPSTGT